MFSDLVSFRANAIVGGLNYQIDLQGETLIIVGPNGSGKSTFLNIFYLFITRQWARLAEYSFDSVVLLTNAKSIELHRSELLDVDNIGRMPIRIRRYFEKLTQSEQLNLFMSKQSFSAIERRNLSATLGIPEAELKQFRNYVAHEAEGFFKSKILEVERDLVNLSLGKVLYMPTYRRIEKDLKSIFPDIEDRIRSRISEGQITARQGVNFQEIISFGMDDIKKLIETSTSELNATAKNRSNDAAQEYIRDMVRGVIRDYSIGPIRDISQDVISEFISRLDDHLLSQEDKIKLNRDIQSLRTKKVGKPQKDMKYLGFFVEKMLTVYLDLKKAERPLVCFAEILARYLSGNKRVDYRNYDFAIRDKDTDEEISLDDLSSGEKQIVSIFAYLLLRDDDKNILIIDEPELSLSMPWQKSFLPDVLATGRCAYVLSVTHSPFVFDNELRSRIVDVRKLAVG